MEDEMVIQSIEFVHCLCLFKGLDAANEIAALYARVRAELRKKTKRDAKAVIH
jgi:hypothetical protein